MKTDSFHGDVTLVSRETVHNGFLKVDKLSLKHSLFDGGTSDVIQREVMNGARVSGVLLYDNENDNVLLIEQFRVGVFVAGESAWIVEVVAGYVEQDESVEAAAIREVYEETGCRVSRLKRICDYFPSAGISSEKVSLFCGLFSRKDIRGRICGVKDENEDIRTCLLPVHEAFRRLDSGEVNNAATVIALQWLKINHKELREG